MSLFGPPNVEKMKAKRNVGGLIQALVYQRDKYVRYAAAKALGEIGDSRAVEPLIVALRDRDSNMRAPAASALGRIRDPQAVEPLCAVLKDSVGFVREYAAEALGEIGDRRAIQPLIGAIRDSDKRVRETGARSLEKIGWEPSSDEISAVYWVIKEKWDQCSKIGAPAVKPLLAANIQNTDERWAVESALAKIGSPAVEPLIGALKDKSWVAREVAAKALGKIGDLRAFEPLIGALRDGIIAAAEALGEIGDVRALEPLLAALNADKEKAASEEHEAEARMATASTPLELVLAAPLNYTEARKALIIALGKIKDARAVEPLCAALRDRDDRVRDLAARALANIGMPAMESLIAAIKDESWNMRKAAAEALVEIGAPAIEPLVTVLKDKNEYVRKSAGDALSKIQGERLP